MGVDRRVSRRARQALVLHVRDVLVRLRVAVLLRETEINDVDLRQMSQLYTSKYN